MDKLTKQQKLAIAQEMLNRGFAADEQPEDMIAEMRCDNVHRGLGPFANDNSTLYYYSVVMGDGIDLLVHGLLSNGPGATILGVVEVSDLTDTIIATLTQLKELHK